MQMRLYELWLLLSTKSDWQILGNLIHESLSINRLSRPERKPR